MTPNMFAIAPLNPIDLQPPCLSPDQVTQLKALRENGFARFLEPEFTDALLAHCFAAKQAALAEAEAP